MPEWGPTTGRREAPAPTKGRPTLSGVLREFENARGDITLAELARKLGVERSALDGMIQLLVRKGRLREMSGADDGCAGCGLRPGCRPGRRDGSSDGPAAACYELVTNDS